ncbi:unnamed protein product [Absidia cylindrospora]
MSNPPKATSLAELRRRAAVDKTDIAKYAMRSWVHSVNRLYEEGDGALRLGDMEKAFVHYMKGCSIMLEVISRHPEYSATQKDPFYIQLRKRTNNEIMTTLEDIGEKIQLQYIGQDDQQVPSSDIVDRDPDVQRALDKYPPISSPCISALDNLPPVPAHIPTSSKDKVTTSDKTSGSSKFSQVTHASDNASISTTQTSSATDSAISNQSSAGIPLPARSNNVFPQTPQVEPRELAKWITRKDNPASILLLDVRPRDMFRQACIKHKWMVQIEPLVLRKDVSSHKIQDSLVLNPAAEQQLFEQRHMFDLVVFYDQTSPSTTQMNLPLKYLKDAIYELEFTKYLNHVPMMLAGGFDAWVATVGPRGVYCFDDNKDFAKEKMVHPSQGQANNGYVTNTYGQAKNPATYNEKTEMPPVNHNIYDYFNHKQHSGNLQSMSRSNQISQYHYQQQPTLQQPYQYQYRNMPMPMPMPNSSFTTSTSPIHDSDVTKFSSRYPDIQPNKSVATNSGLQRHNTFIDNPFHGFTATSNKMYDVPPTPAKPTRPLPPPPSTSPAYDPSTPQRPSSAGPTATSTMPRPNIPPKVPIIPGHDNPHASVDTNSRVAPVSDSSFSQLGMVLIGTTGLKNLGNTCYMNSIIQCLSGTIPFARYFISGMFKQHINKQNPLGTGGILAERFAELLRVMWSENYNFISPVTFREALVRFAPQYSGTEQQDSQEFLNFLLDGIHEDLNAIRQKPTPLASDDPSEEARFEQLPDYQASNLHGKDICLATPVLLSVCFKANTGVV